MEARPRCSPWRFCCLVLLAWFSLAAAEQDTEASPDDPGLNSFVTRPDIRAPKWNVTVYHEDRLAPGLWFVGPYRILDDDTAGTGWVGAHIYDGTGELVWSGADMFSKGNVEDFRISNVRGVYRMTLMDQAPAAIVVMDNHYDILEQQHFEKFNSHELNFVENGTRALIVRGNRQLASREESHKVGFDGQCDVQYESFDELDVMDDWKVVFNWTSFDHLSLEESTITEAPVENRCTGDPWDYLHTNSIDKTLDGDYLMSGRHTDTIYKINHKTGEIIWRLGGVKSDFPVDSDAYFTRQHDVRFRGQNDTHLLLSILDNAKGIDHTSPPSYPFSRGILLAVNERDMTVSVEKQFDHPYTRDRYSFRRGNYQVLPNGNVFMGWSEQGVQSEHSADGTLLMEASFDVRWLGTYRQYKFPFVGEPRTSPDVFSNATGEDDGSVSTVVHVSWNGATEVRSWRLYKTSKSGSLTVPLATVSKTGFETVLTADGFANHVIVVGLDKNDEVLGTSDIIETKSSNVSAEVIAQEKEWEKQADASGGEGAAGLRSVFQSPVATFLLGFFCSAVILLVGACVWQRGLLGMSKGTRYSRVDEDAFEPFTEESDENSFSMRRTAKESYEEG